LVQRFYLQGESDVMVKKGLVNEIEKNWLPIFLIVVIISGFIFFSRIPIIFGEESINLFNYEVYYSVSSNAPRVIDADSICNAVLLGYQSDFRNKWDLLYSPVKQDSFQFAKFDASVPSQGLQRPFNRAYSEWYVNFSSEGKLSSVSLNKETQDYTQFPNLNCTAVNIVNKCWWNCTG
jgi:hypothetical protein